MIKAKQQADSLSDQSSIDEIRSIVWSASRYPSLDNIYLLNQVKERLTGSDRAAVVELQK